MFSGLSRFIKYILPKSLFYRALIIVAAPIIILQLIITIVFYDSVWIKANKNTTRSLVAQLKTIEEVYKNDKKNLDVPYCKKIVKPSNVEIENHRKYLKNNLKKNFY